MKPLIKDSSFPIRAKLIDGPAIRNLAEWLKFAPPKMKERQWQDYRSAKELAQAWLRDGEPSMPVEYSQLLRGHRETSAFKPTTAIAEVEIKLDEFGGPRNSDLVVIGNSGRNKILLAVEAKADEEFDKPIADALRNLKESSNKPDRIRRLTAAVLNRSIDDHVRTLRYQLLHSLAATAIEARQHNAVLGVLLIHEFISLTLDFDKVIRNSNDLKVFVNSVPGWEATEVQTGVLLPPIMLTGNNRVPHDQLVTIGKVRTLLPFGSPGR